MRRTAILVFFVIFIMSLTGCGKGSSDFAGEWYAPKYIEDKIAIIFEKDGTCKWKSSVGELGDAAYTTESMEKGKIMITHLDGTEQVGYIVQRNGYDLLNFDGEFWIKGYENTLAYIEEFGNDIWIYNFAGEYYYNDDTSISHLDEYDQMVKVKTEGGYAIGQEYGSFTLYDDYSGYWYGANDDHVDVRIDRENMTMKLTDSTGYIREYSIGYCEETREFYFIDEPLEDKYLFKYDYAE